MQIVVVRTPERPTGVKDHSYQSLDIVKIFVNRFLNATGGAEESNYMRKL
jgi:hypothetical protein